MSDDAEPMTEGWGVRRPGDRVYHYYDEGRSLCGRIGFYAGPLTRDDGTSSDGDCKPCTRRLDDRRAALQDS